MVVFAEKLITNFNSYLRAMGFFTFLDIRPHVLVVAKCEHPPHILIYSHYV